MSAFTVHMIQADPEAFRAKCFRLLWLLVQQRGGRAHCAPGTLASVPQDALLVMSEHKDGSVTFETGKPSSQGAAGGDAVTPTVVSPSAPAGKPPRQEARRPERPIGKYKGDTCELEPQPPAHAPHVEGSDG